MWQVTVYFREVLSPKTFGVEDEEKAIKNHIKEYTEFLGGDILKLSWRKLYV
jgi:hypothetical protein